MSDSVDGLSRRRNKTQVVSVSQSQVLVGLIDKELIMKGFGNRLNGIDASTVNAIEEGIKVLAERGYNVSPRRRNETHKVVWHDCFSPEQVEIHVAAPDPVSAYKVVEEYVADTRLREIGPRVAKLGPVDIQVSEYGNC